MISFSIIAICSIALIAVEQTEVRSTYTQAAQAGWQQSGLEGLDVHALAAGENLVLAATSDGIFRSLTNGASWSESRYTPSNQGLSRRALALLKTGDSSFTAGTDGAGVWISTPGAQAWTKTESELPIEGLQVISLASNGRAKFAGTVGVGVFRQLLPSGNGSSSWRYNSFISQTITAIAAREDRVIAATDSGDLMITLDDGNLWIRVAGRLPADTRILTLAVDGPMIYAGTTTGLFRSADGGENWTAIPLPVSSEISAVLPDGANLFVGTSGDGVLVSTDGGAIWNPLNPNLTNRNVLSLLLQKGRLYAGTKGGGVFVLRLIADVPPSADSQSVELDEDGSLPIKLTGSDPNGDPVGFKIIGAPKNGTLTGAAPDLIYQPLPNYSGLDSFTFVANDGQVDSPLATVAINVKPVDDPIQLSIEGAQNAVVGAPLTLRIYGFDPDGDSVNVAATTLPPGAVFEQPGEKSRAVVNWIPTVAGIYTFSFSATEENGARSTRDFIVNVAPSEQTDAWSRLSLPTEKRIVQMSVEGTTIYASLSGNDSDRTPVLLRSIDNGLSWTDVSGGLPRNDDFYRITADGTRLYVTCASGIFRSSDGGATWENISSGRGLPENGSPLFISARGDKLIAGSVTQLFISLDAGSRWTEVTNNLPIKPSGSPWVSGGEIRVATVSGDALVVSLSSGVVPTGPLTFRSTDDGASWQSASSGLTGAVSIYRFIPEGDRLYSLTAFYLNFSSDHGANWIALNPLFSPSRPVISPNLTAAVRDGVLLVLYLDGSLQLSRDNGVNWTAYGSIPGEQINALAIGSSSFFAVTDSGKLFRRPRN